MNSGHFLFPLALVCALSRADCCHASDDLGLFSGQSDVGIIKHSGEAHFDAGRDVYVVSGSGANMWFTNDAFHFVWKKISGDFSLSADIRFLDTKGVDHRKACLLIRQSLEPDSAYADAAQHANGLTSLQFRERAGADTREIQAGPSPPFRLGLEKRGDYITLSVAAAGEALRPAGPAFRLPMQEPFYVGLGVCSHDADAVTVAEFSHVKLDSLPPASGVVSNGGSALEVVPIASKDRRIVYYTGDHIEAPNWTRDGKDFIFNKRGRLYKLPVIGGEPEMIDTGFANRCNNDHGLSPDGTQLAISDQSQGGKSLIYLLPIGGGTPRRITSTGPSYWHGWSPDGASLAFCGERNGEFDVYTISVAGGEEKRLTTAPGLDDGPDYSPDGACIYFNSVRTGRMQIWRMKPDGSQQEQVTSDGNNNWFAHPSPDGKWIAFLTYEKEVSGHPENQNVELRLMPVGGGKIEILATLFGGQGTINVPSWSPDSKEVAFVSYLPVYEHPKE
jgi:regulation of enolase protein 1 (concanavalin A-like superfamily)